MRVRSKMDKGNLNDQSRRSSRNSLASRNKRQFPMRKFDNQSKSVEFLKEHSEIVKKEQLNSPISDQEQ